MSRALWSLALMIAGAGLGAGLCTTVLLVFDYPLAWPAIAWAAMCGMGFGLVPWLD